MVHLVLPSYYKVNIPGRGNSIYKGLGMRKKFGGLKGLTPKTERDQGLPM